MKDIEMIRGDTLSIAFGIDSEAVIDMSADTVGCAFSVKREVTDADCLFSKDKTAVTTVSSNSFILRAAPEDTASLAEGFYPYDLQLTVGDDVFTLARGRLHIIADVTGSEV